MGGWRGGGAYFYKIALVLLITRCDKAVNLAAKPDLFVVVVGYIELGEARLALPILNEDEANHCGSALYPLE